MSGLVATDVPARLPYVSLGAQIGDIVEGDVVGVFGAGPVGLSAAKSAWLTGADRVIVIDHLEYRLEKARSFAHWDFPERQPELWPRERSIEHEFLTPVFGTSCRPKGVSGALRRLSYRRYSEARAAHWLLLLAADRIDAGGSHLRSLLTLRPDNPITETGVLSEMTHGGLSSRFGKNRADVGHHLIDPFIVVAPWVAATAIVAVPVKRLRRRWLQR